jgi:hypothetical protein
VWAETFRVAAEVERRMIDETGRATLGVAPAQIFRDHTRQVGSAEIAEPIIFNSHSVRKRSPKNSYGLVL